MAAVCFQKPKVVKSITEIWLGNRFRPTQISDVTKIRSRRLICDAMTAILETDMTL